MSDVFEYRPKYVDIRVKKPDAAPPRFTLGETPCDHVGCPNAGVHLAPKGREHGDQYWRFCLDHVADYNKRWNYFAGMSDAELAAYQAREEVGHRPTWTMRGGRGDRLANSARGMFGSRRADAFGFFGAEEAAPKRRRLTRLQAKALDVMSLPENAGAGDIRARYAELVKRWHPDSNGGDRGAEANLQRVLTAYQTLKAGGLV